MRSNLNWSARLMYVESNCRRYVDVAAADWINTAGGGLWAPPSFALYWLLNRHFSWPCSIRTAPLGLNSRLPVSADLDDAIFMQIAPRASVRDMRDGSNPAALTVLLLIDWFLFWKFAQLGWICDVGWQPELKALFPFIWISMKRIRLIGSGGGARGDISFE